MKDRSSGILLHITSLPSRYGIGDLGPEAFRFVDFLVSGNQRIWQVLPLHPTDPMCGNSPYSSSSAFAGNPLLISPEKMVEEGFLDDPDLSTVPPFSDGRVHYEEVIDCKEKILNRAFERFRDRSDRDDFENFCADHDKAWLDDFALYSAAKSYFDHKAWICWEKGIRDREPDRLDDLRKRLGTYIEKVKFVQYLFYRQWFALKGYANHLGVKILGDIPIYVDYDSADTWSHPLMFKLDDEKRPKAVAGVPPDYFSKTGQRWGNPVYDWQYLKSTGFRWWIERMTQTLRLYDLVRIDHFRGLVAFWEIPAHCKTAVKGYWKEVPVDDFLDTLRQSFPDMPVIAEDLGFITPDVIETMKRYDLPGMKVLQFAFGEDNPNHPYLPHNYQENCVVYTGTHDNNTVRGWFEEETKPKERQRIVDYIGAEVSPGDVHEVFMSIAMGSRARLSMFPIQDVLGLASDARMNQPAKPSGNWTWRLEESQIVPEVIDGLAGMTRQHGRN
jgi:4-alpha-glucanotransferase